MAFKSQNFQIKTDNTQITCIQINKTNEILILSKMKSQCIDNIHLFRDACYLLVLPELIALADPKFRFSSHWGFFLELLSSNWDKTENDLVFSKNIHYYRFELTANWSIYPNVFRSSDEINEQNEYYKWSPPQLSTVSSSQKANNIKFSFYHPFNENKKKKKKLEKDMERMTILLRYNYSCCVINSTHNFVYFAYMVCD